MKQEEEKINFEFSFSEMLFVYSAVWEKINKDQEDGYIKKVFLQKMKRLEDRLVNILFEK